MSPFTALHRAVQMRDVSLALLKLWLFHISTSNTPIDEDLARRLGGAAGSYFKYAEVVYDQCEHV